MTSELNYTAWINDNGRYLQTFSDKRVLVAYAGGKDASVILHFLIRARAEFGFEFETHAAMFPQHVYQADEVNKLDSYWKAQGVPISWHSVDADDFSFEIAKAKGQNPCEVCHLTKRQYFLDYLNSTVTDWNSLVIIAGWSLWDIVGYSLEYLFGSIYTENEGMYQGKSISERFFRTSQRFYPMLKLKEGYSLFKPLLKYNDQDIIKVVSENEIPILTTDCKYKEYRPKRLFADSYIKMGLYFDYDKVLEFAQEALKLNAPSRYTKLDKEEFITSVF
jgi:tRNA(Ile)-lysidine synthase TilS/MesJ